jgi:hypothetical protein
MVVTRLQNYNMNGLEQFLLIDQSAVLVDLSCNPLFLGVSFLPKIPTESIQFSTMT